MKNLKRMLCAIIAVLLVAGLFGCSAEKEYKVIGAEDYENVKSSYKAGEVVEIRDFTVPEGYSANYYVDGELAETWIPDPDTVETTTVFTVTFVMPDHDVVLTRKLIEF